MAILGNAALSSEVAMASRDLRYWKDLKLALEIKKAELVLLRNWVDNDTRTYISWPENDPGTPQNETLDAQNKVKQKALSAFGLKSTDDFEKIYVSPYNVSESETKQFRESKGDPEGKFDVQAKLQETLRKIYGVINPIVEELEWRLKDLQSIQREDGTNKVS